MPHSPRHPFARPVELSASTEGMPVLLLRNADRGPGLLPLTPGDPRPVGGEADANADGAAHGMPRRPVLRLLPWILGLGAWHAAGPQASGGDILRNGAAAGARQTDPSAGAALAAQRQAAASQRDALAKTAQSLQAVRAFQAQARALAAKNGGGQLRADPNHPGLTLPGVPNGLGAGGLQLSGIPSGALAPAQSRSGGLTTVTIRQTEQQALLNWETFNVGRETTLNFDQSAGGSGAAQWIAFNRVSDPSGRPSQILGRISAQGQVYVINQNGIIFGGSSQVSTGSLVASSLPVNDNLIARGLLNNPDSQFLFSALPVPAGAKGTPAFTPPVSNLPDNRHGDVTVEPGAVISSPAGADGNGGRILLAGPNVTNGGSLVAPNGQVILAAGLQVGVDAHQSSDASLRGLDVYVGSVGSYGGTAVNNGLIEVPRGSASLSGRTVSQNAAIESSTTVSLNGRIDLLADYDAVANTGHDPAVPATGTPYLFKSAGSVTLGEGSVTRILPETASTARTIGTELALRSRINLQGRTVLLARDAKVLAPNAKVSVRAGGWAFNSSVTPATSVFLESGGQVYFDQGSSINVAGSTGVTAPVSQVILSLVLRGGELAPSPLQRNGALRGPTLTVDLRNRGVYNGREWVGTPLADLTGYTGLIERTVGELTVAGGSVDIAAGGSVVMRKGSSVNVSGGSIEYLGGVVRTSRVWSDGHLIDIRDATPDRVYSGLFSGTSDEIHSRWGVTRTFTLPLAPTGAHFEPAYLHGGDAGSLSLSAPGMALDGQLTALVSPGPRQLRSVSGSGGMMPSGGDLTLSFSAREVLNNAAVTRYPSPPDIVFGGAEQEAAGPFTLDEAGLPAALDEGRRRTVYLSPELTAERGWSSLTVHNEGGSITVPEKVSLETAAGGAFRFTASNIRILGDVKAPGGILDFQALNLTPYDAAVIRSLPETDRRLPSPNAGRGTFTLGGGSTLSAAGLRVDDRLNSREFLTQPAVIAGGSVSVKAYSADFAAGGVVDVSGGAAVDALGNVRYGNAGSITLQAGQDPQLNGLTGGHLRLEASLLGYSGAEGGTLAIQAPLVRIGGGAGNADTLSLSAGFFSQGGFGGFSLTGLGMRDADGATLPAVSIAPGTRIAPVSQSLVAVTNAPDGGGLVLTPVDKPVGERTPVSLSLLAPGVRDGILDAPLIRGDIVMGEGSVLSTDPLARATLSGRTVSVLGSIFAPGGLISLTAGKSADVFPGTPEALTTLLIGPRAVLSAAGTTLLQADAYGRRTGSVLAGGEISLSGNLLAQAGAVVDVSGACGRLDVSPAAARPLFAYSVSAGSGLTAPLHSLAAERVTVDSAGGSIALKGGEFLFSDATLLGKAGGASAAGGTLSVSSGRFYAPGTTVIPATDVNLTVRQSGAVIPAGAGGAGIGQSVAGAEARGYFTADTFSRGGFDSLSLNGVTGFQGPVSLTAKASLRIADSGVLSADDAVSLTAPYVFLGRAFETPGRPEDRRSPFGSAFAPVHGAGRLTVNAGNLDLGTLSLQNVGTATLSADGGDIRGSGILNIAGDLTLRAAQVYPVTASPFEIFAYGHSSGGGGTVEGSVTLQASGTRSLPLSAGGSLGIYAGRIVQDGVLRAPFGSITLGWDGTGTAPVNLLAGTAAAAPVTRQLSLGAGSITSVSAVDPLTGKGILVPYGVSTDGLTWIDPRGVDITAGGLPVKNIVIAGQNVDMAAGSVMDLRGGGDLFAYRWSEGNGGPEDILESPGRYAVLPGYNGAGAPFAPYNSLNAESNLIGESGPGYVSEGLRFGDRVYLQGSGTLPAGYYTLLPARYALLPGGVLVTPQTGTASGTAELADGSSVVSGYQFNGLNAGRRQATAASRFELASGTVIRQRAEYGTWLAGDFMREAAGRLNLTSPLLPQDSGRLLLQATQSMNLLGQVLSPSIAGGRGSGIDISSGLDFVINRSGGDAGAGRIALSSETLGRWGADSLVIGGRRTVNDAGNTVITATSGGITVDNAGSPLSAADLTLAATGAITLTPGARLNSTGGARAEDYVLTGGGVLVRVSGDAGARVIRTGVSPAGSSAVLTVGAGAGLSGGGITLDSTSATLLDPGALLSAQSYALNSGRISLALDNPGALAADAGLVLTRSTLSALGGAGALSLSSYSTLDLYGSGAAGGGAGLLSLNAGEIRAFNAPASGGGVSFTAGEIRLGNASGAAAAVLPPAGDGGTGTTVAFHAGIIRLTAGDLAFNGFSGVSLNAALGVTGEGSGRVGAQGNLTLSTPLLTGAAGSNRSLTAGGLLTVSANEPGGGGLTPGLGATLALSGRETAVDSTVSLPGGSLSLTSTAGALRVNGRLDVSGQARNFYDVTRYTDAGTIRLSAAGGDVVLGAGSALNLSAPSGGGDTGTLNVQAPQGALVTGGVITARGGAGGANGGFTLDTLSLPATAALSGTLSAAGFTLSQSIRVRTGDVLVDGDRILRDGVLTDNAAAARSFELTADQGSITVSGLIDASGVTGGSIHLAANGNLTLAGGSRLTVAGADFDHAGKGGQITLEAGTQRGGVAGTGMLDLRSGSTLDLSVAAKTAASAALGRFSGKLHLRAPRNAAGTDLLSQAIGSTVRDASSIVMEGYKVYDLTTSGGAITAAVQAAIKSDGTAFLGAAGTTGANHTAMMSRLLAGNAGLSSVFVLAPGAEILNTAGNLSLGTAGTTTLDDWDLSGFRFGEKSAAGVLTLRASGNLIFNNTLSDGFTPYAPAVNPPAANLQLWQGRLTAQNPLLPVNAQSYSYRLTAGADLGAAGFAAVTDTAPAAAAGSIVLGKAGTSTDEQNNAVSGGDTALTRTVIPQRWQVIRTGSGDITLSAAGSIRLLNQFATIYSAGTAVADPALGGAFDVPRPGAPPSGAGGLGAVQNSPLYPAQYSMGGGNVSLNAGGNIERLTRNAAGQLVADSQLQMPSNWLYRRGTVDPATGKFAEGRVANDVLSTSWWVDFNNFFQGVGALGGGNVSLTAAGSVSNVDAVAPTNLRVTKGSEANPLAAGQTAVELGGGDVTVRAGGNIDAGVYYVERGTGILSAGGSIVTNATRSVLSPSSITAGQGSAYTQLPVTLFAGRADFDVSARGDLLLGPVSSPFLLPEGLGNSVWYKSWFSTRGPRSSVNVSSLGGTVTLRTEATPYLQSAGAPDPLLYLWAANKLLLGNDTASRAKPWLRLNEAGIDEIIRYKTIASLLPGSLTVNAYSGDIRLAGNLTLSPSATGTLSLLASGAVSALQPNGIVNVNGPRTVWGTATVNVSDAGPQALPGILSPLGYTTAQVQAVSTKLPLFLAGVDALFAETGSTTGVLQTKQALHAGGPLHAGDPEPLRLYAGTGDISGLTLFSPKAARIFAGRDLSDLSLYIQNTGDGDVSVVTGGRDIIPANAASALRGDAGRAGNLPNLDAGPLAGDIQISGPGTLQVLAGRTLDLGTVEGGSDGTGTGLTSIGNARNPALGFEGAGIIAGAGLGSVAGLDSGALDFDRFIAAYVKGGKGPEYLASLTAEMGGKTFDQLGAEDRQRIALEVFYRVLRDAGRSQGGAITGKGYADGFAAIDTLFKNPGTGSILTRGRDIRTRNGGGISLIAPGGELRLADTAIGNPLAPPGIVTESGGGISIFTQGDVGVGIGRIFTLRGGSQVIWSSKGDIAAGSSSKTVRSAPPTRVLIDPQSGAVQTDLAGLATGGGIGVLATVSGVAPGDVDLIAPEGVVDAGDAGIRSSGNLTIAATQVLNAGNIAVSGASSGTPATAVSAPNVSGLSAAGNTAAAGNAAAAAAAARAAARPEAPPAQVLPSLYTVEVLGYGGGEGPDDQPDDEEQRRRRAAEAEAEAAEKGAR